jgi:hypothetical protein
MKLLFVTLLLVPQPVFATSLRLEAFDEIKLAEFLSRLPRSVRTYESMRISSPTSGRSVISAFPAGPSLPFQISCQSSYFSDSDYVSFASCKVDMNLEAPQFQKKNDEATLVIKDAVLVSAIREAIPEGNQKKEFRAYGKEVGRTSEGYKAWIFSYYFSCSLSECTLKFSQK